MADTQELPAFSRRAVVSFVLGLLAIPLQLPALPAIALGLGGLREIHRSDDRLRGRWMSIVGMILGGAVIVAEALALLAYVVVLLRHNSYRAECQNNLRQIGLASSQYLTQHKVFPPGTIQNDGLPPEQRLSWTVSLLPYLIDMEAARRRTSREDTSYFPIYSGIDPSKPWDAAENRDATAQYIRSFVCPRHRPFEEKPSHGPTYYAGIAGLGSNAAELPISNPNCGFFGYDRIIGVNDIPRGQSYTMMVCETAWQPGPWARGGFATVRGLDTIDLPFTGPDRPFGGLHPNITNLLMADGRLEVFSDGGSDKEFVNKVKLRADNADIPER